MLNLSRPFYEKESVHKKGTVRVTKSILIFNFFKFLKIFDVSSLYRPTHGALNIAYYHRWGPIIYLEQLYKARVFEFCTQVPLGTY